MSLPALVQLLVHEHLPLLSRRTTDRHGAAQPQFFSGERQRNVNGLNTPLRRSFHAKVAKALAIRKPLCALRLLCEINSEIVGDWDAL
jgi:hypothetical protein